MLREYTVLKEIRNIFGQDEWSGAIPWENVSFRFEFDAEISKEQN